MHFAFLIYIVPSRKAIKHEAHSSQCLQLQLWVSPCSGFALGASTSTLLQGMAPARWRGCKVSMENPHPDTPTRALIYRRDALISLINFLTPVPGTGAGSMYGDLEHLPRARGSEREW